MTNALPLSSRIYGRLLVLYAEDLRRDYASEMALVFAEDLDTARREAGMYGVMRVWRYVLGEFLRFALFGQASSSAVRVPAICFALSIAIMGAETAMALRHAPNALTPFHGISALLLLSLSPPLISLESVWACRGNTIISLNLSNNKVER
jgi:hypothetical protein